jgi:small-conductance mechanosensitive channel
MFRDFAAPLGRDVAVILLILLALIYPGSVFAKQVSENEGAPDSDLTDALVEHRIEILEAENPTPKALIDVYEQALGWIKQRDAHQRSLEYYRAAIVQSSIREAEIRRRIDDIGPDDSTLDFEEISELTETELNEQISNLRDRLAHWLETRAALDRRIASQPSADDMIEARLEEIDERQAVLPYIPVAIDSAAPPSSLEASQILHFAEARALQVERAALVADLESQPYRFSRRRVEREEAVIWIGLLETDLQALLELRESYSEFKLADLTAQFAPDSPGLEVLEKLLERQEQLAKSYNQLLREMALAESYRNALQNLSAELQRNYDGALEILNSGGDSGAFGPLLVRYRLALEREMGNLEQRLPSLTLGQLVVQNTNHEEHLYKLSSVAAFVDQKLLQQVGEASIDPEIRERAIELVRQERDQLIDVIGQEEALLPLLRDIGLKETRLDQLQSDFGNYLRGQMLWIRSQTPVTQNFSGALEEDLKELKILLSASSLNPYRPGVIAGLLLLLLALLGRQWYRKSLDDISRSVGRPRSDSISLTLKAIGYCLLLSAPVAFAVLLLCQAYYHDDARTMEIVTETLYALIGLLLLTGLARQMCTCGIFEKHFDWESERCRQLQNSSQWVAYILAPLLAVATIVAQLQSESFNNVLGQLVLALVFAAIGIFLGWLVLSGMRSGRWGSTRYYLLIGVVLLSVLLIRGSLSGYVIAPLVIIEGLAHTIMVLLSLVLVQVFLNRWVTVTRRQIRFRQLSEDSEREDEEDAERSYIADLGELSSTANELINAGVVLVGLAALILIWSTLFPGLSVLQDTVLWTTTESDGTDEIVQSVSLFSVLLAITIAVITLQAARKLPALLELILQGFSNSTPGGRYAAVTLLNYSIVGAGFIFALSVLGIQWSKLQWLVAALGVGIGFGLQELVANFISGLIIFFERPIRVGDLVTVGEWTGKVSRIRIRATTIVDFDRKELLVPNKEFVTGRLLNWSLSDTVNRIMFDVGIAYGSDVDKAIDLIKETIAGHPRVLDDPAPHVLFLQFGDNSLIMSVRVFLDSVEGRWHVQSDLHRAIDRACREAGITIAFPQRDIHFDPDKPLKIRIDQERED